MTNPIPNEVAQQITDCLFAGQKIQAIKLYREHTGNGLKESKDYVEVLETELRAKEPGRFTAKPSGKGCLSVVALCVLAAMVIVVVLMTGLR